MHTSTQITIRAPYDRIFKLGSEVEWWGELLPHYRYVKVLRRQEGTWFMSKTKRLASGEDSISLYRVTGERKLVKMSALRNFMPVTWSAIEMVVPGTAEEPGRILFHHVRGVVRGMDVEWSFTPDSKREEWTVRIAHHLENPPMPVRLLGPRLLELIVGKGFIGHIAGKTLKRIKYLAESGKS
jgi:hypothetical protein